MKKEEKSLKNWLLNFQAIDPFFIQLTLALAVLGLLFAFSSSTYESNRLTNSFWTLGLKQFLAFTMGLFLFFLVQKVNYKFWYKSTWQISIAMLIIMILTGFAGIGKTSGGSQRWLDLGIMQFQPSELAKFSVILLITRFLTKYKWFEFKSY